MLSRCSLLMSQDPQRVKNAPVDWQWLGSSLWLLALSLDICPKESLASAQVHAEMG